MGTGTWCASLQTLSTIGPKRTMEGSKGEAQYTDAGHGAIAARSEEALGAHSNQQYEEGSR